MDNAFENFLYAYIVAGLVESKDDEGQSLFDRFGPNDIVNFDEVKKDCGIVYERAYISQTPEKAHVLGIALWQSRTSEVVYAWDLTDYERRKLKQIDLLSKLYLDKCFFEVDDDAVKQSYIP